jgi:hypothetical protein
MSSEPAPGGADSPAAGVLARLRASLGPETPLRGLPDGLVARSVQKVRADATSWRQVRDRRQRQRLETVVLMTTHVPPDDIATHLQSVLGHSLGTRNFILGAQRRSWQAIRDRFGADALPAAFGLVRCGAIYLRCTVTEELSLGTPTGWYLTEAAMAGAARRAEAATAACADLDRRRQAVLGRLMDLLATPTAFSPAGGTNAEVSQEAIEALAAALESTDGAARLPVLIAAAEDLLAGIRHGSPRTARSVTTLPRCLPTPACQKKSQQPSGSGGHHGSVSQARSTPSSGARRYRCPSSTGQPSSAPTRPASRWSPAHGG